MLYQFYEQTQATLGAWRQMTDAMQIALTHPANPLTYLPHAPYLRASCQVFNSVAKRHAKPNFALTQTTVDGRRVPVTERDVLVKPFCKLVHFEKQDTEAAGQPTVLLVAPMSGHFATLLRDTAKAMLPGHDTYITDWMDARDVALTHGRFDLDDYIDYVAEFIRHLGENVHVIAVCQPAVPVLATSALMAQDDDPCTPASLTLMGGPIDVRKNPTKVNDFALSHDLAWFERNLVYTVPHSYAGAKRRVYPGFLQLGGFVALNVERHAAAYSNFYLDLVRENVQSSIAHETFYDEYLAVMDISADFYLQTLEQVFQRCTLATGQFQHRDRLVELGALDKTPLMTIEGEKDDICAVGQTYAAHALCKNVPEKLRRHYVQEGAGHYGVFSGRRWRSEIAPRIADMIQAVA